jgi:hypothetical protein
MIGKWLQELQQKGSILDYEVVCDHITNEYVVNYSVPPAATTILIEFTIDPITQEVVFKENTNEC